MKKISTHFHLHTIDNNAPSSGDGEYLPEESRTGQEEDEDMKALLSELDIKVPERVVRRLFLKIRISTLRNRN